MARLAMKCCGGDEVDIATWKEFDFNSILSPVFDKW